MKIKSGGGYTSNKLVDKKAGWKVEPKPTAINPASVSTLGMAVQFEKPKLESGPGYKQGPLQPTGIPGTYNAKTQGPGSMRAIYKSGAQSLYGPVNPGERNKAPDLPATKPGRDILRDYGPEATGKGR